MLVLLLLYGVRKYRERGSGVGWLCKYVFVFTLSVYRGVCGFGLFSVCWTWIGLYIKGRNASVLLLHITV